jgi:hypothetical protein
MLAGMFIESDYAVVGAAALGLLATGKSPNEVIEKSKEVIEKAVYTLEDSIIDGKVVQSSG